MRGGPTAVPHPVSLVFMLSEPWAPPPNWEASRRAAAQATCFYAKSSRLCSFSQRDSLLISPNQQVLEKTHLAIPNLPLLPPQPSVKAPAGMQWPSAKGHQCPWTPATQAASHFHLTAKAGGRSPMTVCGAAGTVVQPYRKYPGLPRPRHALTKWRGGVCPSGRGFAQGAPGSQNYLGH